MDEFESQISEAMTMANQNHGCRPGGESLILMRESEARALLERARRAEKALDARYAAAEMTDFDRRIQNLQKAAPYIGVAITAVVFLLIGQAM